MNYLDKYGDFVNENIFKKWFSTSDEEKRKMGYVENDEGELVHPDDIKKSEQVKKDKVGEVKKLIDKKYKNYNIKWIDDILSHHSRGLSFEINYEKSLDNLTNDRFNLNDKEYSLTDLIKSFSVKIILHLNSASYWESRGVVNYVQLIQKMELSDENSEFQFTNCYLSTRGGNSGSKIKEMDGKFYLYITKFIHINYDLTDEDTIKSWKSGWFIDLTIEEQFKINSRLLRETIKKSFNEVERKSRVNKIKENSDYIKECFYEIIDISKNSNVDIDSRGDVTAYFEIDGIKVIKQSENVHTGSYRSRGTAYFNKAKFEINDTTLEFFSMLYVAKDRLSGKIPGCEIDITMENGSVTVFINNNNKNENY